MSSSDRSDNDQTARPVKHEDAGGESPGASDDAILVVSIDERQLMWIALAIVAILVVINGFAILTRDTSDFQTFPPPPFEEGSYAEPPAGSEFLQPGSDREGMFTPTPPSDGEDVQDRIPRSEGGFPNNDTLELVKGEEAVGRVRAFAADFELGKEDTDALVAVVEQTNAVIQGLDSQLASGEIDPPTHSTELERQQESQQQEFLKLIGGPRSSSLMERLRSSSPNQPSGT